MHVHDLIVDGRVCTMPRCIGGTFKSVCSYSASDENETNREILTPVLLRQVKLVIGPYKEFKTCGLYVAFVNYSFYQMTVFI